MIPNNLKRNGARAGGALLLTGVLVFGVACGSDEDDSDTNVATPPASTDSTAAPDITVAPVGTEQPSTTGTEQPSTNGEENDRDEFFSAIDAQLEQVESRVAAIESSVPTLSADLQAQANEMLDELKNQIADIEAEVDEARDASDEDYESAKAQIESEVEAAMTQAETVADQLGL